MRIKASDIPNVKNMTFSEIAEYCKKNGITKIDLDKVDEEYADMVLYASGIHGKTNKRK